jgi:branched-chain amino acid transport system substrate-binding protein
MLRSVIPVSACNPVFWGFSRLRPRAEMRSVSVLMTRLSLLASLAAVMFAAPAQGQKSYGPGASDTEIKIGNIAPSSRSTSEYAAVTRAEAAYFQMIDDRGGINGRKINFISVDDASGARKSVDLARKLVEDDKVLLIFSPFGTETNLAIRAYLNAQEVPQLFVQSSSAVFDDPSHFPWTMGFFATYRTEGLVYAKYILQNKPRAKIAVLYANDDAGKEYLAGVHDGLGDKASAMIVKELSYQATDQTLEPQITALKESGADIFLDLSIGTFATQAIRTAYDLGWHPLQFIPNASLSVAASLDPAGLEKSAGIITNARSRSWTSPRAQTDPAVREFLEWMRKYNPEASLRDQNNVAGYERAEALVEVLKQCGDDLTRANVMKQASSLNIELGMLRPGISVRTSPTDYQPIKQLFLIRFDGREWVPFGVTTED